MTQKKPNSRPRFNGAALHGELESRRNGKPLREFCKEVGNVTPATLLRMGQGGNPSADALVRFLLYLGTTDIAPFIESGEGDD